MGRLVHLVQPELAVQVHRLDQPPRQSGTARQPAVLVVGLRRTEEIDVRGGQDILFAQMPACRLPAEKGKVIAVETAHRDRARPVFLHHRSKAQYALCHHLVLALVIVDDRLLLLRVAVDAGRGLVPLHAGHRRRGQGDGRLPPRLAQRLVGTIFFFQILAEITLHRLGNIRVVLHKGPLVMLPVQAVGNLDAHDMPPLRRACQLPAELRHLPLHPLLPGLGGIAATGYGVQLLPQIVLMRRTVRLRLQRVAGKEAALLRMPLQPPERRVHMQPEHHRRIGTMQQHPLNLLPRLGDVQHAAFRQHLLKPDVQLEQFEAGLGKQRDAVRRLRLIGAVARRTVGQGIELRNCRHPVDVQGRTSHIRLHFGPLHRLGGEEANCHQQKKGKYGSHFEIMYKSVIHKHHGCFFDKRA